MQNLEVIPIERIASFVFVLREEKIILDSDLADLYGVTTGNLNKAVKRNLKRFPDDFMFQITQEEYDSLLFQNGISKKGRGGRRTLPYAFTEQGIAMLASVLNSDIAIDVNITIMRTFVRLRKILATHDDIVKKINEHDKHIRSLYSHVEKLLKLPNPDNKPVGYIWHEKEK